MGDAAAWAGVVVAAIALGAGIVAARGGWRLLLLELDRDKTAKEEARRTQATRVCAWIEMRALPDHSDRGYLTIFIRNASELPVYDAELLIRDNSGALLTSQRMDVLPPGNVPIELPQYAICDNRFLPGGNNSHRSDVLIRFRDITGVEWIRDAKGALIEMSELSDKQFRDSLGESKDNNQLKSKN